MTSFKTWLITAGWAGIGGLLGAAGGNFLQEPEICQLYFGSAGTVMVPYSAYSFARRELNGRHRTSRRRSTQIRHASYRENQPHTAVAHSSWVYKKLNASNRTEQAIWRSGPSDSIISSSQVLVVWSVLSKTSSPVALMTNTEGVTRGTCYPLCDGVMAPLRHFFPAYSITSSARASSVGGTSRPSAFAVVKLMTSSNLVGCSTGMSAGFAPRRTLSTISAARRNKSRKFGP
jgi:hypothetical protein